MAKKSGYAMSKVTKGASMSGWGKGTVTGNAKKQPSLRTGNNSIKKPASRGGYSYK
jgi:hypothetical protein